MSAENSATALEETSEAIKDSPVWTDGDFSPVSSDGWRYRVRSAALCWVSNVLNDAIESCTAHPSPSPAREITFTDPQLETSSVLERFLLFMTRGTFDAWGDTFTECEVTCRTVTFMRKYECGITLRYFKIWVEDLHRRSMVAPLFLFMLAAALDDVEMSVQAFDQPHRRSWYDSDWPSDDEGSRSAKGNRSADRGIPGVTDGKMEAALLALSLDKGGDGTWPFELWRHIPAEYLWAASSAWANAWASKTATEAVDGARDQVRKQAEEAAKCANRAADEAERAAKKQRTGTSTSTPSAKLKIRPPQYSITYSGKVVYLAPEYEAAIKAVKKITT